MTWFLSQRLSQRLVNPLSQGEKGLLCFMISGIKTSSGSNYCANKDDHLSSSNEFVGSKAWN